jgi:hypothetical protein
MPIFLIQGEDIFTEQYLGRRTVEAQREIKHAAYRAGDVHGPTRRVRVARSLAVAEEGTQTYQAYRSAHIVNVHTDPAYRAFEIQGLTKTPARRSLAVRNVFTWPAYGSMSVGQKSLYVVRKSVEPVSGISMLILADIIAEALAIDGTDAESSIQIINLGGATDGTWTVWLNYAGQFLETENLSFDSTAQDVEDAMVALVNVPTAESIRVEGLDGGPYTVYFEDEMGNRFIYPLVIDIDLLTGGGAGGVTVPNPGATMGSFSDQEVSAQLLVNGEEVLIKDFQYNEPVDKLGAFMNARLAVPNPAQLPNDANYEFNIIANGVPRTLVKDGRLASRDYRMAQKGDEVNFSLIDVIADKFTLAPRRPVIMFNPDEVEFKSVEVNPRDAIKDERGQAIMPIYEYVGGLTMKQILKRAYTGTGGYSMTTPLTPAQIESMSGISSYFTSPTADQFGLGFANVVTNIGDYKVRQAMFDIESGWHAGAQPFVGMYNPQYLPLLDNLLCVLSIENPLPFGAIPRVIPVSLAKTLVMTKQFKNDTNAALLTYQMAAKDDPDEDLFITAEEEVLPVESGVGLQGNPGYAEITTRIRYLRKKRFSTLEVVGEVIDTINTQTRAIVPGTTLGDAGILQLVHEENQQNIYYDDMKTGHHRTVSALMLMSNGLELIGTSFPTILWEDNESHWINDPTVPGQKLLARGSTRTEGLVYRRVEEVEDAGGGIWKYQYPILLAQSSGVLLADYQAAALGDVSTLLIETTEEILRHTQGNQYDCVVTTIDHLNGGSPKRSIVAPRTGDTSSNPFAVRSKTQLFRDLASEAVIGPRIPITINAGGLPYDRAVKLKDQMLNRAKNPLNTTTIPLANKVDFGLAKGSVIVGQTRWGYTPRHIVVGLSINGENLQSQGHKITMSVEALELPEISS